jgi:hypothetical protein
MHGGLIVRIWGAGERLQIFLSALLRPKRTFHGTLQVSHVTGFVAKEDLILRMTKSCSFQ